MGGDKDAGARSGGTLIWALRTAGIAGFVGLAVTQYLAHGTHRGTEPTRVAQAGGGRIADPETTGSIVRGARTVRLDPCNAVAGAHGAGR